MSHSISLILSFFYFRYKLYSDSQKIPNTRGLAPMLEQICLTAFTRRRVSMPSRAYTSFLPENVGIYSRRCFGVNALSGLYLISTQQMVQFQGHCLVMCQCPLGLIPHFYLQDKGVKCVAACVSMPSRAYTSFLLWLFTIWTPWIRCVNALSGLYLISTVPLQKPRFYAVSRACFCRYLSEYSDNSRFSCMLTFWTYLMRCTYPWHWIKYSTKYNRCHLIFSLSW